MLSTIGFVVAGLSTGHKIGLGAVGAAFIIFALVSSFVLPLRNPNFPGRAVGWYVTLGILFFAAMLTAVIVFGREKPEASAAPPPTTSTTTSPGATSTSSATSTGSGATQGDPVAGKAVFASAGCTGCHTLKAAGATGTVGPNLDQLKPEKSLVETQVTNGGGGMPPFRGVLSEAEIEAVAEYVSTVAGTG
jgi:mono/diheme cytochrome c family protein